MENLVLKIEHVTKRFPGVVALNDVSFSVKKGEVHGIVGENGAGKSTLIKAIMGVYPTDGGKISIFHDGDYVEPKDALDAKHLGMYANYQHVSIADSLTVAENYFLGNQPTKHGRIDWAKMTEKSREILNRFNMSDVDPKSKIESLPIALKEMIMISKISMMQDLKLVIFDEPTALLEESRADELFQYIAELKKQGISIIYISHHLEEIVKICDRVTVLKDGCFVTTKNAKEVDKDKLISLMVGREIADIYNIKHTPAGEEGQIQKHQFQGSRGRNCGFLWAGRRRTIRSDAGDLRGGQA